MNLHQVTIYTDKLQESVEFYKKAMGLEIKRDLSANPTPIVFMSDGGTFQVELIVGKDVYSGGGITIGFACEDLKAEHERLEQEGFASTDYVSPNPRTVFFFVYDSNGVRLQVSERRK